MSGSIAITKPATTRHRSALRWLASTALVPAALLTGVAHAGSLPTGGSVSGGSATIASGANTTTVTQTSQNALVNWQSFSVGQGNAVNFIAPNAQSATLNRVTGDVTSTIAGQITSNGAVYLVNPNGIVITPTGSVNTGGGFVASTLDIADDDFMAGRLNFTGKGASKTVTNAGSISTGKGAYVALLGGAVANSGTITVPLGKLAMGSGEQIALDLNGGNFLQVAVPTSLVTGGNALVDNSGTIVVMGGSVQLQAAVLKDAVRNVINMSGSINADSAVGNGGTISLIGGSDQAHMAGTVTVSGSLSARATGASGNGGTIETSGEHVNLNGISVSTLASHGKAGNWTIDPADFTVAASGGDITGAQLSTNLAGGNVTILSSSGTKNTAGNGDININDTVSWSKNTLTLDAYRNINVNAVMNATGTAGFVGVTSDTNVATTPGTGSGGSFITDAGGNTIGSNGLLFFGLGANGFYGKLNIASTGSFSLNGQAYVIINSLGAAGSTTGTDLQGMNGNLSGYYVLGSNIDASATSGWNSGAGFTPIAAPPIGNTTQTIQFQGVFNGLGHTISNLYINNTTSNSVGLFGTGGGVMGVGMVNANITSTGQFTGALGGWPFVVINSYSTGTVTANSSQNYSFAGGLVGSAWLILNSFSNANVANSYSATNTQFIGAGTGGLAGGIMLYGISGSYATGTVTATSSNPNAKAQVVGGLVGGESSGAIYNSYATGAVSGVAGNGVGGLAGGIEGTVEASYATGAASGTNALVAGLVGENLGGIVTTSYASGGVSVTGTKSVVGGLVAASSGTVSNSYWDSFSTGQSVGVGVNSLTRPGDTTATKGTISNVTAVTSNPTKSGATNYAFSAASYASFSATDWLLINGMRPMVAAQAAPIQGGTGFITSATQLQAIDGNAAALAGNYVLVNAIDLSATGANQGTAATSAGIWGPTGWVPLGQSSTTPFSGSFNGQLNTISNLTVNAVNGADAGLFGDVSGSVNRLGVVNASIATTGAAGAASTNQGASGGTGGVGGSAGAIAGALLGTGSMTADYATGSVTSTGGAGGTGYFYIGGSVGGTGGAGGNAGGLVGSAAADRSGATSITQSYASVNVASVGGAGGTGGQGGQFGGAGGTGGAGGYAGGLVGELDGGVRQLPALLQDAYALGSVATTGGAGGAGGAGGTPGAAGSAGSGGYAGGVVGYDYGNVNRTYATGAVSGSSGAATGGIAGNFHNFYSIDSDGYDSETTGQSVSAPGAVPGPGAIGGLTTAQMMQASNFAGWTIDTTGAPGSSAVWRQYNGSTMPLLAVFMTPVTITANVGGAGSVTYNAQNQAASGSIGYTATLTNGGAPANAALISGTATYGCTGGDGTCTNAGSYTVGVNGGLYSGQQGYNLNFVAPSAANFTITPANLVLSGSRTYDGTSVVAGSTLTATGVGGQTFTVTGAGDASNLASKNAGSGLTLASVTGLALGTSSNGGLASNYNALSTTGSSYTVNTKTLTGTIATGQSVYAQKLAPGAVSLFGVIGSDQVSSSGTVSVNTNGNTSTTNNLNAGSYTGIESVGSALSGADAGNYSFAGATGNYIVTKAPLTVTGQTANNKTYDATTAATLTGGSLNGMASNTVLIPGSPGYTVGICPNCTFMPGTMSYPITTTDKVTLVNGTGTFAQANVGNGIAVTVTGTSLSGADAGNYTVANPTGITANITPATLTVTPNAASVTYSGLALNNGAYSTNLANYAITGFVAGQSAASTGLGLTGSMAFNGATATQVLNVGSYALTQGTLAQSGASNYTISFSNPNANAYAITPASLVLTGSRTYDGTSVAAGSTLTATGVNGQTFTITGAGDASNLASQNVQYSNGQVTGQGLASLTGLALGTSSNGGLASNYNPISTTGSSYTITPANLTLIGGRVYDGTTMVTGGTINAFGVNGEEFAITGNGDASNLASANASTTKQVLQSVTGLSLGTAYNGALAGNYNPLSVTGSSYYIGQRSLMFTPNNVSVTYSGNALNQTAYSDNLANYTIAGFAPGETAASTGLSLTGTMSFGGSNTVQNAGTYSYGQGSLAITGASNYLLQFNPYVGMTWTANAYTITPANLVLSGSRTYDGTTVTAGSTLTATGVNGQTFTVTGSGASGNLASKNAGTGLTLASVSGLALGTSSNGGLASNYNPISTTGSSYSVGTKALTVTGQSANGKTYDATTTATLSGGALSGVVSGDQVNLVSGSGAFAQANVGNGIAVAVTGTGLSGADAGNYTVANPTGLTANITPATLTLTPNAGGKTYDATALNTTQWSDALANYAITGFVAGQSAASTGLGLTGSMAFNGSTTAPVVNAGSYVLSQGTLVQSGAGNYAIAFANPANNAYVIGKAPLTLTGANNSLVYTAGAQSNSGASYAGAQGNDSFTITGYASGTNVGSYTDSLGVSANGSTLLANYSVQVARQGQLTITPASLTVTGNTASTVYDGAAQANGFTTQGLLGSDKVTGVSGLGTGTNVGTYADVLANAAGSGLANYTIRYVNGGITITPAPLTLTYTATPATSIYGNAIAPLAGSVAGSGFVGSDSLASLTGTALWSTSATSTGNVGAYAITGGGLTAGNYAITAAQAPGNAGAYTITARPITVTANPQTSTYGGALPALSYVIGGLGLVNGDTLAGALATSATSASPVGSYAINQGTLAASGNYRLTYNGASLVITPAPLTLTYTATPASVLFGQPFPAFTGQVSANGLVNGDTLASLAGSASWITTATQTSFAGSYPINGSGLSGGNYTITVVQAPGNATALTIQPSGQSITSFSPFAGSGSQTQGVEGAGGVASQSARGDATGTSSDATVCAAQLASEQYRKDGRTRVGTLATSCQH